MKAKPVPWNLPSRLKEWWWLICLVAGAIVVWGNLPMRMAKAEEQLDDLKGWAKEIQGYTRAMNQQMVPNAPPPVEVWRDEDGRQWCCEAQCGENQNWWSCDR